MLNVHNHLQDYILKMEAAFSSESLASVYQSTRCNNVRQSNYSEETSNLRIPATSTAVAWFDPGTRNSETVRDWPSERHAQFAEMGTAVANSAFHLDCEGGGAVERENRPRPRPSPRITCHELFCNEISCPTENQRQDSSYSKSSWQWLWRVDKQARFLLDLFVLLDLEWRRNIPPKRRTVYEIHGVTTLKTVFFTTRFILPSNVNWGQKIFITVTRENVQDSFLLFHQSER
jgi:hypothetical protein